LSTAVATPRAGVAEGLRYLAVSIVLFGGVWPITKAALAHATPLWFATSRAALACLVTAVAMAVLGRLRLPSREDVPAVLAIGLLQLGGFFALSHLALDYIPAGRTAILSNVTVFWLIPLSMLFLDERVSRGQWAAVAVGLAGVAVLIQPWSIAPRSGLLPGYAMLLMCSLFWSLAVLVTRRWRPRHSVMELLPWCFALATLFLAPIALFHEPAGGIGRAAYWHALFIGIIAAPIGTWATTEVGRRLSGTMASVGFLLVPAMGLTISTLWLGEPLGWDILGGGGLIAVAVVLAARG